MKKFLLSLIVIAISSISLNGMKQESGKQLSSIVATSYDSKVPSLLSLADKQVTKLLQENPQAWKKFNATLPHEANLDSLAICFGSMQQEFNDIFEKNDCANTDEYIRTINMLSSFGQNPYLMERVLSELWNKKRLNIKECARISGFYTLKNNFYIQQPKENDDVIKWQLWNLTEHDLLSPCKEKESSAGIIRDPDLQYRTHELIFSNSDHSNTYIIHTNNQTTIYPNTIFEFRIIKEINTNPTLTIHHQNKTQLYTLSRHATIKINPECTTLGILSEDDSLTLYQGADLEETILDNVEFYDFVTETKILVLEKTGNLNIFDLLTKQFSFICTIDNLTSHDNEYTFDRSKNLFAISSLIKIDEENIYKISVWDITSKEKIFEITDTLFHVILAGNKLCTYNFTRVIVWNIDNKNKIFDKTFEKKNWNDIASVEKVSFIYNDYLALLTYDQFLLFNLVTGNLIISDFPVSHYCHGKKSIVLNRYLFFSRKLIPDILKQFDIYDNTLTTLAEQCTNTQVALLAQAAQLDGPLKLCTQSNLYKHYQDQDQAIPTQLKELLSIEKYVCPSCAELNPKECDNLQ